MRLASKMHFIKDYSDNMKHNFKIVRLYLCNERIRENM